MDRKDIRKLNKRTDLLSGRTLSCDRRLRRCTVIFLMLFCFVLWCSSIGAEAAQSDAEDRGTVIEAETDEQSEAAIKAVTILVEGIFEKPDRDGILARINEIRREACEEGVRDPATGEPMRAEDYVPLVWSYELEEAAARRAVESMILRDHVRPDGSECFSVLPDSEAFSMEKSSYVEETGAPAGHYMALISPSLRYAAAADFQPGAGQDACAGAFGRSDPSEAAMNLQGTSAEETAAALLSQTGWEIHLDKTVVPYVAQLALARTARLITKGIWNMD